MSDAQVRGYAAQHRKQSKGKRIGIIVGAVLLALLLAVGGYYLWFALSLNNSLSKNSNDQALQALENASGSKPFYVLVLASDERRDEHDPNAGMQTDVMMLVRVDTQNDQVTMLSIPRDTRYVLDDGTVVKINALYNIGGVKKVIEGVSELTNLPITHYAMVYMSDLRKIVDEIGGVEIDVPKEINNNDPVTNENVNVQPGVQVLDGQHAQAFAISRHEADTNEDAYRQGKIRQLFGAILRKALDRPVLDIPGTVINLAQYVETDMRANDLIGLAAGFSNGLHGIKIYKATGPSDGGIDESAGGQWLCYENPEGWAKVVSVMDSGGDPATVKYD